MSEPSVVGITKLTCLCCGHVWTPRSDRIPTVCPRCKRYDWNITPSEKSQKVEKQKGGVDHVRAGKIGSRGSKPKRSRKKPSAIDTYKERMSITK